LAMNNAKLTFLNKVPPFAALAADDQENIAKFLTQKNYARNTVLFFQGKSNIENLFIINNGAVELFFKRKEQKLHRKLLQENEVFGGIAILMSGGKPTVTAQVAKDSLIHMLPRKIFLETCIRHKSFYEFFEKAYLDQVKDPVYESILSTCRAFQFLKNILPFSLLPEDEIEAISSKVTLVKYPKDSMLFVQDQTRVENLYIILKGAAERYYEESDRKIRGALSGEGTVYGGISMLLNDNIAVRTLRVNEDSDFYVLPKVDFLHLCAKYDAFYQYFTATFGKRMMDNAYAELILKSIQPEQESVQVFNLPVSQLVKEKPLFCDEEHSIRQSSLMMLEYDTGAIFVRNKKGHYVGLITESDLAKKVIPNDMDTNRSVSFIMSSPIQAISEQALLYEAHLAMIAKDIRHLAIENSEGQIAGIISRRDLLLAQAQSPSFTIFEIATALKVEDVYQKHKKLPNIINGFLESGATVKNITRYITTFSDTILNKLVEFALDEMGPAPCRFAFMIMGSEGRREQTLKTDQDNAIIFEDISDKKILEQVQEYFLNFGEKVCGWLDRSGFEYCKGEIMAKNPKWCQPLSVWKKYFSSWIFIASPEDLLESSIFFDFRGGYGDNELIKALKNFLKDSLIGWAGFFRHLTENALYYKPPLGFFGNILVESKGKHRDTFDIKAAMMPVIDFARIYGLKHHVEETNTQERLFKLHLLKVLNWEEYNELEQAYSFLMQLRFRHQVQMVTREKVSPDNFVNLKKLSRIEQAMLKEIFKRIDKFQSKLNIDFTGLV
jgi:CBS domain-containing protein